MRLQARWTGADVVIYGMVEPPFGPGFAPAELAAADTVEQWFLTAPEDAEDAVVWRALKA